MENYGICAKLVVRANLHYDGSIQIHKNNEDTNSGKTIKLRVYDTLTNHIQGVVGDELIVAPLASFKWLTKGGPYSWNNPSIGNLQVEVNGVQLDPSMSTKESYLYPKITCPNTV